jgi:hypothetical protein
VPVSPPNWVRVADQILLTILGVDGLDERLANADRFRAGDPAAAAAAYGQLADTLLAEGFAGHAHVLRRKQLDALGDVGELAAAAALTAQLAATALHEADLHQARQLDHQLSALMRAEAQTTIVSAADSTTESSPENGGAGTAMARHAQLIHAAVAAAVHQLGDSRELITVLRNPPAGLTPPGYQPLLVLLLAELTLADAIINQPVAAEPDDTSARAADSAAAGLAELDDLSSYALIQLADAASVTADRDVKLRLRLLRLLQHRGTHGSADSCASAAAAANACCAGARHTGPA